MIAAGMLMPACTGWFGDENSTPAKFEVRAVNQTDRPIYVVFGPADATEPSGRFSAVRPREERPIRVGVAAVGDEPGGCFEHPLWLIASRSGQSYQQGNIAEYADDLEIVRHFKPGECTDQEQIVVEYYGS